jgi:hypothetical protein
MMPDTPEFEDLALYHETDGGEAALVRKHRDDAIRAGVRTPSATELGHLDTVARDAGSRLRA